jgi:hypothetical protein
MHWDYPSSILATFGEMPIDAGLNASHVTHVF